MSQFLKEFWFDLICGATVVITASGIFFLLCIAEESYMDTSQNVNHAAVQYFLPVFTAAFSALSTKYLNRDKSKSND